MALLAHDLSARVGGDAWGEVIGQMVVGGCARNGGDELRSAVDVFARGRGDGRAVEVLGDDLASRKDVNGGGAARGFLHAQVVAVVGIRARGARLGVADHAVLGVVYQRVQAVVGHVAGGVVGVGGG